MELTKLAQNTVLRLQMELTQSVSYTYGKATLTWFEEIFEEYEIEIFPSLLVQTYWIFGFFRKL